MTSEEALGSGEDVTDYNGRSKRVDDVLVVGVKQEPVVDVAWITSKSTRKADDCIDLQLLLHECKLYF